LPLKLYLRTDVFAKAGGTSTLLSLGEPWTQLIHYRWYSPTAREISRLSINKEGGDEVFRTLDVILDLLPTIAVVIKILSCATYGPRTGNQVRCVAWRAIHRPAKNAYPRLVRKATRLSLPLMGLLLLECLK
jgi:hypothetical protein